MPDPPTAAHSPTYLHGNCMRSRVPPENQVSGQVSTCHRGGMTRRKAPPGDGRRSPNHLIHAPVAKLLQVSSGSPPHRHDNNGEPVWQGLPVTTLLRLSRTSIG